MNNELLEALTILEKEKDISKDTLLEAIENSLITACKNHFGKSDNIKVNINPETCEFHVYAEKTVVEEVEDSVLEISLANAKMMNSKYEVGDIVNIEVKSKEFGRIATQNAKNVILQKIREEERKVLFDQYYGKEKDVVTGIVQRYVGKNISINLGKVDAILSENEQVKSEVFKPTERIKLYILEVKSTSKGPKILVSRTHPELVKRLFESEVTEVKEGIVEIKSISREAGSRTKIAVWSNDPDVDPVGACVGLNGARVNAIVNELRGEKIDIINWSDNAAMLIENALSPAKVISVIADAEEKTAKVVVPDYQLSLAIGKEGQNARLAARLTGFKIDIKSETQARESGDFMDYENDYEEYEEEDSFAGEFDEIDGEGLYSDGPGYEGGAGFEGTEYAEETGYDDGFGPEEVGYAEEGDFEEGGYPDGANSEEPEYAEEGDFEEAGYSDGANSEEPEYANGPDSEEAEYTEDGNFEETEYSDGPDSGEPESGSGAGEEGPEYEEEPDPEKRENE